MTLEELLVIHPAPWREDADGFVRDAHENFLGANWFAAKRAFIALVNARAKAEAKPLELVPRKMLGYDKDDEYLLQMTMDSVTRVARFLEAAVPEWERAKQEQGR